jgi:hypothetical protein
MMPEITRLWSTRLAPGWFFGRCGSIAAHCSSLNQNSALIATSMTVATPNHDLPTSIKLLIGFEP